MQNEDQFSSLLQVPQSLRHPSLFLQNSTQISPNQLPQLVVQNPYIYGYRSSIIYIYSDMDNDIDNATKRGQKLTMLVVGKPGHGKSSFCRMIASQYQRKRIYISGNCSAATRKCSLYKSDNFSQSITQDIYLLDTPGLQGDIFMLIDQIDQIIFQQRLSIIGIVYVINLNQNRLMNLKEESEVEEFLMTLKISYIDKIRLSMCVLTHYDKLYNQTQTMDQKMKSYQQFFKRIQFGQLWERRILWISERMRDRHLFLNAIQNDCKQSYQRQFSLLSQFVRCNYESKLSYQEYRVNCQTFEQTFIKHLELSYEKKEFQVDKSIQLVFAINISDHPCPSYAIFWSSLVSIGTAITAGIKMVGPSIAELPLIKNMATKVAASSAVVLASSAVVGSICYFINRKFIPSVVKINTDHDEYTTTDIIQKRARTTLVALVSKETKIQEKKVKIGQRGSIISVHCFQVKGQEQLQIEMDRFEKKHYLFNLHNGEFRVKIECKHLNAQSYKRELLYVTRHHFGKK